MIINSLKNLEIPPIKAVIFDCFGTMLDIKQKRNPYLNLLRKIPNLKKENFKDIMKYKLRLEDLSSYFNVEIEEKYVFQAKQDLEIELNSIFLYQDVEDVLNRLNNMEIKTLVCSNLAYPYGVALEQLPIKEKILSYEVGYVKPEKEMYELCREKLKVNYSEILFVGDNQTADYNAPQQLGMKSLLLSRK